MKVNTKTPSHALFAEFLVQFLIPLETHINVFS